MLRSVFTTILGAILICAASVAQPPKGKDAPPKDGKDSKAPKDGKSAKDAKTPPKEVKAAPPVMKELAGIFKTKNIEKKTLTLTVEGKEQVFRITDATKFTGPRGGVHDDRLKDELLDKGFKIAVVVDTKDVETAVEVKLPFKNTREDPKGKAKDKQ